MLYMVYHYYMPGESLDRIRESVEPFREKSVALSRVTLPTSWMTPMHGRAPRCSTSPQP